MPDIDAESEPAPGAAPDLSAVKERISELQQEKRRTVRWHMSRETAERAIAAITVDAWRPAPGRGKPRRRRRHKRLL